jgi:hypothetical protein
MKSSHLELKLTRKKSESQECGVGTEEIGDRGSNDITWILRFN